MKIYWRVRCFAKVRTTLALGRLVSNMLGFFV
jgi:hypothetical protein